MAELPQSWSAVTIRVSPYLYISDNRRSLHLPGVGFVIWESGCSGIVWVHVLPIVFGYPPLCFDQTFTGILNNKLTTYYFHHAMLEVIHWEKRTAIICHRVTVYILPVTGNSVTSMALFDCQKVYWHYFARCSFHHIFTVISSDCVGIRRVVGKKSKKIKFFI